MGNRLTLSDTISGAPSGNGTTDSSYTYDAANRLTALNGNSPK